MNRDRVGVVYAPSDGDDTTGAIAEGSRGVVAVTADRDLANRVRVANANVVGPSWTLDRLVE
jgi:hypothetical protein